MTREQMTLELIRDRLATDLDEFINDHLEAPLERPPKPYTVHDLVERMPQSIAVIPNHVDRVAARRYLRVIRAITGLVA